jgi:hypothetical protein
VVIFGAGPVATTCRAGYAGLVSTGPFGHLVVIAALAVNLWLGGDLVEARAGSAARHLAELFVILGYLWFVLEMRVPLPWARRAGEASGEDERAS